MKYNGSLILGLGYVVCVVAVDVLVILLPLMKGKFGGKKKLFIYFGERKNNI
jgi:hypothetical protein